MADEAHKTNRWRGAAFIQKYLSGTVLDVGCGPDLVVPHAVPFDLAQGDANELLRYFPAGTAFDCVHSSHCLEHMLDASHALSQWWALVKLGGFMIVVVPEEDLYEQHIWPPVFNDDHKATFRIHDQTWSPVSLDMRELISALPGARIESLAVQSHGYDRRFQRTGISSSPFARASGYVHRRRALLRILGLNHGPIIRICDAVAFALGFPIDQTEGSAMAQIQAVIRKQSGA